MYGFFLLVFLILLIVTVRCACCACSASLHPLHLLCLAVHAAPALPTACLGQLPLPTRAALQTCAWPCAPLALPRHPTPARSRNPCPATQPRHPTPAPTSPPTSCPHTQVCVTIVGTYFLLNAENYHWHWTAFSAGASTCECGGHLLRLLLAARLAARSSFRALSLPLPAPVRASCCMIPLLGARVCSWLPAQHDCATACPARLRDSLPTAARSPLPPSPPPQPCT